MVDPDAAPDWFSMGYWLVGLAVGVCALGALIGFTCVRHGRQSERFRPLWFVGSGVCMGVVGMWLATAVPLLGVSVPGSLLRFDVATLVVALVVAFLAVVGSLLIMDRGQQPGRVLLAGPVLGVGATLMLYLELDAADIAGSTEWNWGILAAVSVGAVIVATMVLWLAQSDSVARRIMTVVVFAAGIMGLYFLGLTALDFSVDAAAAPPKGVRLFSFVYPTFIVALLFLAAPITASMIAPSGAENLRSSRYAEPEAETPSPSGVPA